MHSTITALLMIVLVTAAHAVPTAVAFKADTPPSLDGKLDDALWQRPPQIKDFVVLGKSTQAQHQTQAWIAYDTDNLYIAIKAFDSQMDTLKASITQRDGRVWGDDVIELFFDPACTGFSMLQLAFNPLGTQADLAGDAVGMSDAWNGVWTVKTGRGADFWCAEVMIPFANFGLSRSVGHEWAINICRERAADGELSCWSQTGAGFAVPNAFGKVALAADLTPFYLDLGVQDWGQGIIGDNLLQCSVRNTESQVRRLTARLQITGPDGKMSTSPDIQLNLAPNQTSKQSLPYQLTQAGAHLLTLLVKDGERLVAATGRTLPVAQLAEFSIFKSFYHDDAVVRYQVNVQPRHLSAYHIDAHLHADGASQPLAVKNLATLKNAKGEIRFDTKTLPTGQYIIDVTVRDRQASQTLSKSLRFAQLVDRSLKTRLTTVRAGDNMLLINGKPFFPIGLYEAPGTELYLKNLADAGFNLCHSPGASGQAFKALLDRAQSMDMKMWISVNGLLDFSQDVEAKRKQLTDLVINIGSHPGLLCWESMDEPVWGSQNADAYYEGYSFLRALDQQHPIWTNHAPRNTIAELANWNRATDIGGVDIYPVPEPQSQSDLPNKTISVVGDECDKNISAVNGEKPVFMVLQGFGWGELSKRRGQEANVIMPTFQQSRFMAYQAIAHGANGILYWGTHYTQKPSRFWSELRSLVSELGALQDVLASKTIATPKLADVPTVRVLHKQTAGYTYLILVNESAEPVKVTLSVPQICKHLRRLFEGQDYAIKNGTLSLRLNGYDVAVLSDNLAFPDKRKDFSAEWQHPTTAADSTLLKAPGNNLTNPGFEVATDDGLPIDWDAAIPLTVSLSETSHTGKYSVALTGLGTPDAMPLIVQHGIGVQGGQTYRFSGWVKAPETAEARLYVEWMVGGTFHAKCLDWTRGTGDWQQLSYTFKADPDPAGRAYGVAQIKGSGTVLFDDLKLEEVAE